MQINTLIEYFTKKHSIVFNFKDSLFSGIGKRMLGYYDVKNNEIFVDTFLYKTERFAFVLAHELGHYVLHNILKINQKAYDDFEDSEYDFSTNRYLLNNYKNWIEWQANQFASCLIMPEFSFITRLSWFQKSIGVSKHGCIYLDNQPINQQDFVKIKEYLSEFFNTTQVSITYRLEDLNLITDVTR